MKEYLFKLLNKKYLKIYTNKLIIKMDLLLINYIIHLFII